MDDPEPFEQLFRSGRGTEHPDTYAHTDTFTDWQTVLTTGQTQRVRLDLTSVESNNLILKFFENPATTSTTGQTGLVGIWGVSELNGASEYVGDYLGKAMILVGEKEVDSSAVLPHSGSSDPAFWVREIGVQDDRSLFPGMRIVGQEGEAAPVLVLDTMGYTHLIIEMRRVAVGTGLQTSNAALFLGFLYRFL